MSTDKIPPEQSAINLDIEEIEINVFADEKRPEKRRGKAFQYLCLSILCDLDINEIEDEDIIDGNDEEGIDIINLYRPKEDKIIINILNCKSSQKIGYSANDLTKLGRGLEYIFEEREEAFTKLNNDKLIKKIEDIRDDKEKIVEANVYYCAFNGRSVSQDIKRKEIEIENRYTKFFKSQYPNAKFNFVLVGCDNLFIKKYKEENL